MINDPSWLPESPVWPYFSAYDSCGNHQELHGSIEHSSNELSSKLER